MTSDQSQLLSSDQRFAKPRTGLRSPRRITITVSHKLYQDLVERSEYEGRSLSNLAAFLLEKGCCTSLEP